MEIEFYDIEQRRKISIPLDQVRKAVCKRTVRNGKGRIHYLLVAQLDGTVLKRFVRREDWLALDIPQI